ncbi:MAG: isocitrate lyase/phosphoenolpyruvate mutase family protein [Bacteroidetes bacterium]|nr:isocitrate lyase/phosphoenolpyruvate mutase family protein [Bacteroidota bacterium]
MNQYQQFVQLHQTEKPLLLGNCWDVNSAQQLQTAGYKAIGTSSWAVAKAMGLDDGEQLPFEQLLQMVQQVKQHITIPLTVDLERGYSNTTEGILQNIHALYDAGVSGINIEDSTAAKELLPAETFASQLSSIKNYCRQQQFDMFINARTDAFLLQQEHALKETLQRVRLYEASGADGIFVPFMTAANDIQAVTAHTVLPVNILASAALPSLDVLNAWGVKRVSMGASLFRAVNNNMHLLLKDINNNRSLQILF